MNTANAIELYKNGDIDVFEAIYRLDTQRTIQQQKNQGVVYTPKYIADYIIKQLQPEDHESILEPSAGHGLFAFCLLEYFSKTKNNVELAQWFEKNLFLSEIDPLKVNETKSLLSIYFSKIGINTINLNNVVQQNTLATKYKSKFDIMLGNPPYIRSHNLLENELYFLKENFESCMKGNIDIYYAFLEFANQYSKRSGFIIPNTYLKNKSADKLRIVLKDNIESIIDFEGHQIFKNASIYTSLLFLNEHYKNKHLFDFKNSINNEWVQKDRSKLNNNKWIFNFENNKGDKKISDIVSFISQTATCKDAVFIIKDPILKNINGTYYYSFIKNKTEFTIEKDICLTYLKINKIHEKRIIIFPYDSAYKCFSEDYLKTNFPYTFDYLKSFRNELLARDKGKTGNYENWFAYGRKQGINTGGFNYYLVFPSIFKDKIKPTIIEIKKEADKFLASSGYIMGSNNYNDIVYIKNIIESKHFTDYLKNNSKILSGKTPYYNFTPNTVKNYII